MPKNTGSFIFGLTFGALCGVVMALLLTPQSGEETRELLGKKTDVLRKGAEDAVERARESTAGFVERGRNIAEDAQTRLHGLHATEQPAPEPQPEPERAESQVQV
ncbi:MAG: YtxH domain-containing protein [Chloroflexota bacterium]|nr:YtxH domain-containing protein [Chloroflexota bacterium]